MPTMFSSNTVIHILVFGRDPGENSGSLPFFLDWMTGRTS